MQYPKALMTIKELEKLGWTKDELMAIYRSRHINRDFSIAYKIGTGEELARSNLILRH